MEERKKREREIEIEGGREKDKGTVKRRLVEVNVKEKKEEEGE